ncbi:MAG: hypothetical protein ACJASK_002344, partial [Ilumatobacter sp.]
QRFHDLDKGSHGLGPMPHLRRVASRRFAILVI